MFKKMHQILLSLLLLFCVTNKTFSQESILIDQRDGEEYTTVKVGEKRWFKDYLKYETALSHCPNFNKKEGDCTEGNYYSYIELDTICPKGWHVVTTKEWSAYFDYLRAQKQVNDQKIKIEHTKPNMPNLGFMVTDTSSRVQLFGQENPVNLAALGWVEGRKRKNFGTLTLWVRQESSEDEKYHLHIGPNKYIEHTHRHHIIDKPKKRRKFMVKCVCD